MASRNGVGPAAARWRHAAAHGSLEAGRSPCDVGRPAVAVRRAAKAGAWHTGGGCAGKVCFAAEALMVASEGKNPAGRKGLGRRPRPRWLAQAKQKRGSGLRSRVAAWANKLSLAPDVKDFFISSGHSAPMPSIKFPLTQSYLPATFLERGASVPFTTPQLSGTRARTSLRDGVELVVPNPVGGRGVYILPWTDLRAVCLPTVHDRMLCERVAGLAAISPAAVREAARGVAAEGHAGPAARQAAIAASEADRRGRLVVNFLLLTFLMRQIGLEDRSCGEPSLGQDFQQRARKAVAAMAARLGRPSEEVAAGLEAMGSLFAANGLPGQTEEARIPHLLGTLRRVSDEVGRWHGRAADGFIGSCAGVVTAAAAMAQECAWTALAESNAMTGDIPALLRKSVAAPEDLAGVVARPDWLLYGWEQTCSLWDAAAPDERAAALVEMAMLVPVLPQETVAWTGTAVRPDEMDAARRRVILNDDWRAGTAAIGIIERNERLRAMAA